MAAFSNNHHQHVPDLSRALSLNFMERYKGGFTIPSIFKETPDHHHHHQHHHIHNLHHTGGYGIGELQQSPHLYHQESREHSNDIRPISNTSSAIPVHFSISAKHSPDAASPSTSNDLLNPATSPQFSSPTKRENEARGDSHTAETSTHTDTSNDDLDGVLKGVKFQERDATSSRPLDQEIARNSDAKTLRRLAQNREAARKSRLRKKAYIQQLESSRVKLNQIEQELQGARQQGLMVSGGYLNEQSIFGNGINGSINAGAASFEMEYARWLDDQHHQMGDLRAALHAHIRDEDLSVLVDNFLIHYNELFQIKSIAVKSDVFHVFSGMWKTPAEQCFMWMGGFRPSELLKILIPQIEPLTEQQFLGIYNLQQSSQQAEEALSQGMESLQQTLVETLSTGSLYMPDGNISDYMSQMAMALGKLTTLESFIRQADLLRQQTLQQMRRLLTIRQAARGFVAMNEYFTRLRALSSLWSARPRD